jgi:ABC-type bacteriocin/lantibiotic exporter with double-glycine peptidase domain
VRPCLPQDRVRLLWKIRIREPDCQTCRSSPHSGTTGTNLMKGAKRFGFNAEVIDDSNFRTIAKWLRRGVPVIVDWMSTASSGRGHAAMARRHYSVICGLGNEHIVLQDPAVGGRRRLSRNVVSQRVVRFQRRLPQDRRRFDHQAGNNSHSTRGPSGRRLVGCPTLKSSARSDSRRQLGTLVPVRR